MPSTRSFTLPPSERSARFAIAGKALKPAENFPGLARINRDLIARAEAVDSPQRVVLHMDSTGIPVYGHEEHSAYNGQFECTCYDPLLLFNREADCLAAKLRPGNVHSAAGWEELLLPEIERQQKQGKQLGQVGVVLHLAPVDQLLELDGQRHQVGDPGNAWRRRIRCLLWPARRLPRRPLERDLVFTAVFHFVPSLQNSGCRSSCR